MAWKQITKKILGNSTSRGGFFSRRLLFISFLISSGFLYLIPQNYSNKFQLAFAYVFRFPLGMTSNVSVLARVQERPNDIVSRKEYEALRNNYLNLEQMLKTQREKFNKLTGLYNSYIGKDMVFVMGNIIQAAADIQNSESTINCRGTYGLEKGQFVLGENNSIIGTITDISPQLGKAKLKLITDIDSKIAVKIEGWDQKLQMQGNGDGTAKIRMVSKEQKIEVGQNVFALDQAGLLDSPMIVGTVGKISKREPDAMAPLLWEIIVKPAWELKQLNEVAIIVMKPPQSN